MTYTVRDILEISNAAALPSIKMAELIVQKLEAGYPISNFVPATFLVVQSRHLVDRI